MLVISQGTKKDIEIASANATEGPKEGKIKQGQHSPLWALTCAHQFTVTTNSRNEQGTPDFQKVVEQGQHSHATATLSPVPVSQRPEIQQSGHK